MVRKLRKYSGPKGSTAWTRSQQREGRDEGAAHRRCEAVWRFLGEQPALWASVLGGHEGAVPSPSQPRTADSWQSEMCGFGRPSRQLADPCLSVVERTGLGLCA